MQIGMPPPPQPPPQQGQQKQAARAGLPSSLGGGQLARVAREMDLVDVESCEGSVSQVIRNGMDLPHDFLG